MKYASIHAHREHFSIERQCRILRVTRSGYYAWCKRDGLTKRARKRQEGDAQVAEAFAAKKGRYGAPRLHHELHAQGCHMNRKTLAESLRRQGLRARAGKRFRVVTTDSNHNLAVAPNLLDRDFTASAQIPKVEWRHHLSNTLEGLIYMALVRDLCSCQVVGYAMPITCVLNWSAMRLRPRQNGVGRTAAFWSTPIAVLSIACMTIKTCSTSMG
jgi:putative transposase